MWSYTLRRALATLPTLLLVITVCYLMLLAIKRPAGRGVQHEVADRNDQQQRGQRR